jgi:putative methionine-R-sulfoxide reductase with GAF domain
VTGQRDVGLRERVLEAVTDSSLAELEFEKLLDVLLRRVRDLFAVDTATVLLLDTAGEYLVATATAGLEEEIFQGVRVPVGAGFAGRVAVRREPVVVDEVGPSTVVNPLLWEHGLRVLLGVPMIVGGQVNGVVHVGSETPGRRFTDEDTAALQLVADRLALTAHAHRSRSERAAATLLQASLLPAHLPAIPGWELAARYVSAESGVGGDWYDVFPLPGNRLGVVIGDVVGNGLAAAVVMGRLRSALRAYALEFPDPADVLGRLDHKASHFEHNTMATVGYAVIDPNGVTLRLSLAGHLPPVLAMPGRPAVFTDVPVDPPVGQALAIRGRRSATVEVPVGALVALYTDGLVERRDEDIDARLARLLTAVEPGPPEVACARIMAEMVGARQATDDIALLTARHMPG